MVVVSFGVTRIINLILVSVVLHQEEGTKEGVNHEGLGDSADDHTEYSGPNALKTTDSNEPHVEGILLAFHINSGIVKANKNVQVRLFSSSIFVFSFDNRVELSGFTHSKDLLFKTSEQPRSLEGALLDEEVKVLHSLRVETSGDLLIDVVLDRQSSVVHVGKHVLVDHLHLVLPEELLDIGVDSAGDGFTLIILS